MKIYYTCSTGEFNKYKDTYFEIRDIIIKEGHVLTRDWLTRTENIINTSPTKLPDRNMKEIYKGCIESLREADLVIIEDTVSNFSTGHQITLALQYRRPTLVLWQSSKHRHFNQMFIHGIESDILEVVEYEPKELQKIIRAFIKKYSFANDRNRFHLVLSNTERQYLDWAQFTKNKSRTALIRDVLRKAVEVDGEYAKYLERG